MHFMQGACKNGTDGTRDQRWFAIVYPSAHICNHSFTIYLCTINFMLIGIAALITVVQPYKKTSHNIFDTLIVLTVTLITASMTSMSPSVERQHSHSYAAFVLTAMSFGIPLLYLTAIVLHWVYRSGVFGLQCRMCKRCRQTNVCCSRGRRRRKGRVELSGSLPDRNFKVCNVKSATSHITHTELPRAGHTHMS